MAKFAKAQFFDATTAITEDGEGVRSVEEDGKRGFPFAVERNIEAPALKSRYSFDFSALAVGDSFLVPAEQAAAIRSALGSWSKKTGQKFVTAKVEKKNKESAIRVWRCT